MNRDIRVNTLGLASTADAADMLGITRQRIFQLKKTDEEFPKPVYDDGKTIVLWKKSDIRYYGMNAGYIKRW